jgi:Predicted sulfurtransferase
LNDTCKFNKIRGTVIIAKEGINGSVAGTSGSIRLLEIYLKNKGFDKIKPKYSYFKYMPFFRLKVKIKKEIVTFRSILANPEESTGKHIKVNNWNNLIKDKKNIVIDVRNNFEFENWNFQKKLKIPPNKKASLDF